MARQIQVSEAAAARRRVYFHCVDATDGITAELGEVGGQPETSIDGAAWVGAASIGVLVAIGNGRYYAEVAVVTVNAAGRLIETRYKSAATAESVGDSLEVVNHDPVTTLATAAADVVNIDGDPMRGTDGVSLVIPDVAGTAAGLHGATDGLIGGLVVPDVAGTAAGLHGVTDGLIGGLAVPDVAGTAAGLHAVTDALLNQIKGAVAGKCFINAAGTQIKFYTFAGALLSTLDWNAGTSTWDVTW